MATKTVDKTAYKIVANSNAVAKEELDKILKQTESSEATFTQLLLKSQLIKEADLLALYSKGTGIPLVNLKTAAVDKNIYDKVPVKFAWYYKFFPFKFHDRKLAIAISQLLDINVLDEIRFGLGCEIETAFAPQKDIEDMLKKHYGLGADTVDKILTQSTSPETSSAPASMIVEEDIEKLAETASVVQLVNQIILEAYKKGASDIHFEPFRGKIRFRYRIDGVLHEAPVPQEMKKFFMPILSRIKIMANLNIVERRLPQDGKVRVKTQEQSLDLRISCIPTLHGESMVIRILPSKGILDLDQLGFEADNLKTFQKLLREPHGIIFVTGPTGSGKSTTLYAGINTINTMQRKVITIEDPVEYEMDGVTQIQVSPEIGLTFSRGLRSVLRHDPDVMMVGEVRDLETADIAIRVALTGHLILSTLHTNDAASGITRLLDIGVEPYLVASSVIAFMAQRLVRVICPHCKEPDKDVLPDMTDLILRELGEPLTHPIRVQRGRGCDSCNDTGFAGRIAIHEILPVDEEIRRLIMARAPAETIKLKARQKGMLTMRQDGWRKVMRGVTTPEEIIQAAPADPPLPGAGPEAGGGAAEAGKKEKLYFETTLPWSSRPAVPAAPAAGEEKSGEGSVPSMPFPEEHDSDDLDLKKKRKYQRISVEFPVYFRFIEFPEEDVKIHKMNESLKAEQYSASVENLSAGGLMFRTRNHGVTSDDLAEGGRDAGEMTVKIGDFLKTGVILELEIELPDKGKPIECMARVLRVQRLVKIVQRESSFEYRVSVCFLAISPVDVTRLEGFCEETEQP